MCQTIKRQVGNKNGNEVKLIHRDIPIEIREHKFIGALILP